MEKHSNAPLNDLLLEQFSTCFLVLDLYRDVSPKTPCLVPPVDCKKQLLWYIKYIRHKKDITPIYLLIKHQNISRGA